MRGALEQRAQLGRRLKHASKIVAGEDEEQTGGTRAHRDRARNVVDQDGRTEIARAMSKATLL